MTPSAAMAPEKMVTRACLIAMIAAMKNVLSPNSETIITLQRKTRNLKIGLRKYGIFLGGKITLNVRMKGCNLICHVSMNQRKDTSLKTKRSLYLFYLSVAMNE